MRTSFLHELKHGIVHLFYPRLCEGCSKALLAEEMILCIGCNMHIPETGYHDAENNETAIRFAGRIPFKHATSFAYFGNDGLLQHLLHGLKYRDKKEIGHFLGRRFAESLKNTAWIGEIDLIIPVPLHDAKKASRGYNQSMLIAESMGAALAIPVSDNLLLRTKDTESQTKKTRTERVDNMAGVFKIRENAGLAGKHILICDDVLTTGATIEACALTLLSAGNIKISIATIGIAVA